MLPLLLLAPVGRVPTERAPEVAASPPLLLAAPFAPVPATQHVAASTEQKKQLRKAIYVKDTFPPALPPHRYYHNARYTTKQGVAF